MDDKCSDQDVLPWLILIRASGITPLKFRHLMSEFNHPYRVVNATSERLLSAGLSKSAVDSIFNPDQNALETDLRWLSLPGNHFLSYLDSNYPVLLREISDPPLGLFVRGSINVLGSTQMAIVGSRTPTAGGKRTTRHFAESLGNCGLTITSGLALGIDTSAHLGALGINRPTIAVLGNGLDTIYPAINLKIAEQICDNSGAVVSEFPHSTRPLPQNFPRRNRIISGLSVGTLVIEAAPRSGSLITARFAMEQGREVFAIPGSIYNPLSRGCHALIRDGAKLTESIEDVLEEIGHMGSVSRQSQNLCPDRQAQNETLDEHAKVLLDNIGYEPVTIDLLVEETGFSAKLATAKLLGLELQNLIESLPGGSFIRKN